MHVILWGWRIVAQLGEEFRDVLRAVITPTTAHYLHQVLGETLEALDKRLAQKQG